jgi:hypothetical protein
MVIKEQNVHLISTNRKALCNRSGRPNTCLITTKLKRAGAANNSYADGRTDGRAGIVEIRIDGRTDGRQLRPDTVFFFPFLHTMSTGCTLRVKYVCSSSQRDRARQFIISITTHAYTYTYCPAGEPETSNTSKWQDSTSIVRAKLTCTTCSRIVVFLFGKNIFCICCKF